MARTGAAWSVKGIDGDTRAIARARAGESDLTIGAWVDQAILAYSSAPPPSNSDRPVVSSASPAPGEGAYAPPFQPEITADQDILALIDEELDASRERLDVALRPIGYALKDLALRLVAAEAAQRGKPESSETKPTIQGPPAPPLGSLAPAINNADMPALPSPRGHPLPPTRDLHPAILNIDAPPIPARKEASDKKEPRGSPAELRGRPLPFPPSGDMDPIPLSQMPAPPERRRGRSPNVVAEDGDIAFVAPEPNIRAFVHEPSADGAAVRFTGIQQGYESNPDLAERETRAKIGQQRRKLLRIAAGIAPLLIIGGLSTGYFFADSVGMGPLRDVIRQKVQAHSIQAARTVSEAYEKGIDGFNRLVSGERPGREVATGDVAAASLPEQKGLPPSNKSTSESAAGGSTPSPAPSLPPRIGSLTDDPKIANLGIPEKAPEGRKVAAPSAPAKSTRTASVPPPPAPAKPGAPKAQEPTKAEMQLATVPKAPTIERAAIPPSNLPDDISITTLKNEARAGDPRAQHELARRLIQGDGVEQNFAEASELFREAAIQGVANAQYNLGVLYERGLGVTKDDVRALLWYHSAAEQSHPLAQYNLGIFYLQGRGIPLSYAEAARWFRAASDQGVAKATYNLAVLTEDGLGTTSDRDKAIALYEVAAEAGHPEAASRLSLLKNSSGQKPKPAAFDEKADTQAEGDTGGTTVADIQARLRDLGIYDGRIDGIAGPKTRTAIREFQKLHALPITGIPSEILLDFIKTAGDSRPKTG